ncbi:RidA family protein [Alicyclobacillus tolerans]|uniref:2-iminobutanoate/2-iminopropanoate deaminase n=2 Tax=Alicyclobacillus tolerans TaxID=90970 RepID=A0ABT9LZP6_9BACL|nr:MULTISPECIES: RidA family protein [Alicyclobacillus]MDP9729745.1 2-iminobutanoate/2-iminopropanoate deaminase [Alicyclobacillus tengchongensis]SHK07362.1 2-iminobutanoate/2-iminopropanoate deaminase [Alicyclobacillus montanus]
MKMIATEKAPAAIGPYSQAVQLGNVLYTSGQIPLTPAGEMVTGGIEEQTKQVLDNLDAVLHAAGMTRQNVVKTTIFLTDLAHFQTVNSLYAQYFGDHRPARSTVQVAALPRGAQVEIELVAALE